MRFRQVPFGLLLAHLHRLVGQVAFTERRIAHLISSMNGAGSAFGFARYLCRPRRLDDGNALGKNHFTRRIRQFNTTLEKRVLGLAEALGPATVPCVFSASVPAQALCSCIRVVPSRKTTPSCTETLVASNHPVDFNMRCR